LWWWWKNGVSQVINYTVALKLGPRHGVVSNEFTSMVFIAVFQMSVKVETTAFLHWILQFKEVLNDLLVLKLLSHYV
jgi:hypothetical protein